jgi:hypothetical protein
MECGVLSGVFCLVGFLFLGCPLNYPLQNAVRKGQVPPFRESIVDLC